MPEVVVDQGLLTGLLALQLGFVTREAAAEAIRVWAYDGSRSLGQVLAERGVIDVEKLAVIEALARDLGGQGAGLFGVTTLAGLPQSRVVESDPDPTATDLFATRMPTTSEVGAAKHRFRRLRTHAEGGLGIVFVAHDGELNRDVALKEIKERSADDPQSRARFLLEAEVTGGLEHPGIVPVYSLGQYADGRPYYAMRFVRGMTLQAKIDNHHAANKAGRPRSERSLEFNKLLRTFLSVCNTIGYAHSRGVIHRDVKPSNILLGKFGETIVVDWGLAKPTGQPGEAHESEETPLSPTASGDLSATMAGSSVGTPGYMSPEQAAGRLDQMGPTSDIFSLGATLYTILTGRSACDGASVWEAIAKLGRGEFTHPRQIDPSISRGLEAICLKAMALRPEDRYQTAAALAEDVEDWLGDESISAMAEDWMSRISRWGRKHRAAVTVLVLGLVLLTTIAIAATLVVDGARRTEQLERLRAESLSSSLSLDRALGRFERGEASRAMLRLTQSLSIAPPNAVDLRAAIRSNLAGWGRHLIPLKQTISHSGMVHSVAFSPDGRRVMTGCTMIGTDSIAAQSQLWDVATGEPVGPPHQYRGTVLAIWFGPAGTRLLTGRSGTAAQLWDGVTGRPIGGPISHPEEVRAAAFRLDGRRVALAGSKGQTQIWDIETNRPVGAALDHPKKVLAVSFSPDGSRLLTGCADGSARVWDADTGRLIGEPLAHGAAIHSVTFRPDGLRFATGGVHGLVRFWETKSSRPLAIALLHASGVYSLAYSADGSRIATGSEDNSARLWDADTGRLLGIPMEHRGSVESVAISPDGSMILSGSGDRTARVWDVASCRFDQPTVSFSDQVESIVPLDGETVLIASHDGKVGRYQRETLAPASAPWDVGMPVRSMAVRPGGGAVIVVTSNGKALRVDPLNGRTVEPQWVQALSLRAVAYRPDGRVVLTGGDNGIARLWDDRTGEPLPITLDHRWPISVVAFHPNRPIALTAGGGVARLWNLDTGQPRRTLPTADGSIYVATFSPDGRSIATGGEDNMVRVWDAETGNPIGLPLEHRGSVVALAYSSDSRSLVTGSNDGIAVLWNLNVSRPLGPPMKHAGRVSAVAFSASGGSILTGSHDQTVRLWPIPVPVIDDVEYVSLWVRALTGMALDTDFHQYGVSRILDAETWRRDRRTLDARGGPPRLDSSR